MEVTVIRWDHFQAALQVQAIHTSYNSLAREAREKKWNLQMWAEADDETDSLTLFNLLEKDGKPQIFSRD